MRPSALLLAAVALLVAGTTSRAVESVAVAGEDAKHLIRDLQTWLGTLTPKATLGDRRERWLDERVGALAACVSSEPASAHAAYAQLLDIAGYDLTRMPERSFFVGGGASYRVRLIGHRALESLTKGAGREPLLDFLTRGVLADARSHPPHRRWMALYLLHDEQRPALDRALLTVARDRDDPLNADVLSALSRRSGVDIDVFLVGLIDEPRLDAWRPHPHNLLRTRLELGPLAPEAAGLLVRKVKALLLSSDWRDASRAIELAGTLDPMRVAPMLVEALFAWQSRSGETAGARRTTWELVRELRRLSGKSIGANAKNWTTWWRAVKDGTVALASDDADAAGAATLESRATFFGLEAVSDRVTFVIDHSGSMAYPWGPSGRTRFQEAIEQLMRFLQAAGEDTRFNIILFSSSPIVSTPHLVAATPDNLERARKALVARAPDGGTNLRSAIEYALKLDEKGNVAPSRMEADTIVVLCDGETDSGSSWAHPLLDRVNADLRLVIHCAQIGGTGDGTLQLLARRTGGEFTRVDP